MKCGKLITFRGIDEESKMEFTNNSLNLPKTGKVFRVGLRARGGGVEGGT